MDENNNRNQLLAKRILEDTIGKVAEAAKEKYQQLERRIHEELETEENQYKTVMTIIKRQYYDPTNKTLYPVIETDRNVERLKDVLSNEQYQWVDTIYLEMSERSQRQFEAVNEWKGVIEQDGNQDEVMFQIHPAKRYRDAIEKLYQIFQDNHIPWETVNTAYLDKFYDVYMSRKGIHKLPAAGSAKSLNINFGNYKDHVQYGMIPLWNLEWKKLDCDHYRIPCMNGIYYEHEFILGDKSSQDGYLIETKEEVLEIRHEKEKIVVKSKKENLENSRVLHMIQERSIRSLDYSAPLLTNYKKNFFVQLCLENSMELSMTRKEMFRRIMEFDIQEYIQVTDCQIADEIQNCLRIETMNWFVQDGLFPVGNRKILLMKFKAKKPENYLNDGIIRYVISQLQLEIREYRCVGVME